MPPSPLPGPVRLDGVLTKLRLCSRRQVAKLVESGSLLVNDSAPPSAGFHVNQGDIIRLQGRKPFAVDILAPQSTPKLFVANKRAGEIVTRGESPKGENFFTRLEAVGVDSGLVSVGRLDVATQGLILLTDNGRLQRFLEMSDLPRIYEAKCWSRRKVYFLFYFFQLSIYKYHSKTKQNINPSLYLLIKLYRSTWPRLDGLNLGPELEERNFFPCTPKCCAQKSARITLIRCCA